MLDCRSEIGGVVCARLWFVLPWVGVAVESGGVGCVTAQSGWCCRGEWRNWLCSGAMWLVMGGWVCECGCGLRWGSVVVALGWKRDRWPWGGGGCGLCRALWVGVAVSNYEGGVTSMEPFLKKFFPKVYTKMNEDTKISNYCKFDSQLLTSFTSSLYIAGLVASLFASSVTRAFGRKPSILVGAAAFLVGSALGGAAMNVSMLIFGRIFLGIGIGFANQSVPLYLSEMAPPNYRGATNIGFELCVGIAMAAVPASILTLGALFLPETPNSLIQNNKDHEKAKLMLQRVRGTNDVQAELDDLIKASSISKTIKHPFKNILQRKYRPQLVMAIAIPFFQQVTGINVITFYAPVLFRTIGFGESAHFCPH
uniref:Major facilitator superfamily (MFS) profile domain-containing protein n=1 Tax=Fagus sylvatica TaxID=28930 RepID=A0A2N9HLD8_FAGSY